ncbi:hypothetical protein I5E68_15185 [Novosphingobium sp. YJ-S2-02]|uniref:Uncharacterized protein n=1 Tax=Novosphingobium aureum TaxID=2792964 RepID=A0A931HF62_9SPHN|nr:hypothetical protein [Novosphingobium aureum]MBH0114288.1 hypothetical protein [Novosphingobium aureum]
MARSELPFLPSRALVALVGTLLLGVLTGATIPTSMKAPFGPDWRRDYGVRFDPSLPAASFTASRERLGTELVIEASASGTLATAADKAETDALRPDMRQVATDARDATSKASPTALPETPAIITDDILI